jgi:transporter family protein
MWVLLGIVSLIALGVYDILKKLALNNNAVLPVLFFSTLASALLFLPLFIASRVNSEFNQYENFFIPPQGIQFHILIIIKTVIVVTSWILSYMALKNLPITIVSPIRSTGPVWTLIGAIVIYGESLNGLQWLGMAVVLVFFYIFSRAGSKEGISFRNNKWIWFIFLATLIGTISTLFDKFLIDEYNRIAVQAYFSFYQVPVMLIVLVVFWFPKRRELTPFKWKYIIPFIGIILVLGDFAYFYALTFEDSLVSILSLLRRSSVIISFGIGAVIFKEKNKKYKGLILLGIIIGIYLIVLGS